MALAYARAKMASVSEIGVSFDMLLESREDTTWLVDLAKKSADYIREH